MFPSLFGHFSTVVGVPLNSNIFIFPLNVQTILNPYQGHRNNNAEKNFNPLLCIVSSLYKTDNL